MMNKLGLYINNLMSTIKNTEEKSYLRELALEELKKLQDDVAGFIFEWVEEIDTLPVFEADIDNAVKDAYMERWTCSVCEEHTHEVNYDYLSGTDHLECVSEKTEKKHNKQTELEFDNEWRTIKRIK